MLMEQQHFERYNIFSIAACQNSFLDFHNENKHNESDKNHIKS